jgi:molecular chaperone GrpE
MLRAMAETENVRRRADREREDTAKYAVSNFARDLAGVADNLRRALEAAPAGEVPADAAARLVEGVAATERELLAVFGRHGLARIQAEGQRFDPNLHQAVFEVEGSGQPPGTVVQVMAPGYTLHGRLLRPAMVGVAKGQPQGRVDTTA